MKLFSRWRKREGQATLTHNSNTNHKSVLIGNKHRLFDDIIGFEDVKTLFEMAIKAERPVHLLNQGDYWYLCELSRRDLCNYTYLPKANGLYSIGNSYPFV
jgi:hypothetical protein